MRTIEIHTGEVKLAESGVDIICPYKEAEYTRCCYVNCAWFHTTGIAPYGPVFAYCKDHKIGDVVE